MADFDFDKEFADLLEARAQQESLVLQEIRAEEARQKEARRQELQKMVNEFLLKPEASFRPGEAPDVNIVPSPAEARTQVVGGFLDLARNLLSLPAELRGIAEEGAAQLTALVKGEPVEKFRKEIAELQREDFPDLLKRLSEKIPDVDKPESVGGSLIRGLSAYLPTFFAVSGPVKDIPFIAKLIQAGGKQEAIGQFIASAVADFPADMLSLTPGDPKLSNLIQTLAPSLRNPILDYLATPPGTEKAELSLAQQFEERLKAGAEGTLINLGGAGLVSFLAGIIKTARKVGRVIKTAAALGETQPIKPKIAPAPVRFEGFQENPFGPDFPLFTTEIDLPVTKNPKNSTLHPDTFAQNGIDLGVLKTLGQAVPEILELHKANGGSTFNLATGKSLAGQEAFAVSIFPEPEISQKVVGPLTRDVLGAWITKVSRLVPLDDPRFSVETWLNPEGITELDVVVTPTSLEEAVFLGKKYNQRAIFNLKTFEEIHTGGTGLALDNLPPLQERIATVLQGKPAFKSEILEPVVNTLAAAKDRALSILKDETGAVSFAPLARTKLSPELSDTLTTIGAVLIARRKKTSLKDFIQELRSELSLGAQVNLPEDTAREIYKNAQKTFARHVKSAISAQKKSMNKALASGQLPLFGIEKTETGLPKTERLMRMFEQGKFRADWYDGAREELQQFFGQDWELVADFIAALSVQNPVKENVDMAIDAYIHFKTGGRLEDLPEGFHVFNRGRLLKQVLEGRQIETPKAGAFARNIKGDPNAVTIDRWMVDIFFPGKDFPSPAQSRFLQEWIRQLSREVNVAPREYQAALWVAQKMAKEALSPDDPTLRPLREFIREKASQALAEGRLVLPDEIVKDEEGFIRASTVWFLTRVVGGAFFGGRRGETPEEKLQNALIGAGIGAILSPVTIGKLVKKGVEFIADTGLDAPAKRARVRPEKVAPVASEVTTATPFSTASKTYLELVEEARRGVRPREVQFADAAVIRQTMTVERIKSLFPPITLSDSEAIALVQVITDEAYKLLSLARQSVESGFSEESVNETLKQLYLLSQLDPKRLGALAEAGRTLQALNDPIAGMNDFLNQFRDLFADASSGLSPQTLISAISALKTPEEIITLAQNAAKPEFKDFFFEVWINGLLSSPKAQVSNVLSNFSVLTELIGERRLAEAISGGEGVAPGESLAMVHGTMGSIMDAWRAAARILRDEETVTIGLTKIEPPRKVISSQELGLTGPFGVFLDALGAVLRLPGKALKAGDLFFRTLSLRAETRALARRAAFQEVSRLGLEGAEAVAKAQEIEAAFLANIPPSALKKADRFAAYATFSQELGEFGKGLEILQQTPIGRVILPFVKAPINIFKFAGERLGPLSVISPSFRKELFSNDPVIRDLAVAKMTLSSMAMATFAYLTAAGYITGGGPKDKTLRKQLRDSGWQPYSIWFDWNFDGKYDAGELVAYNRIEPLGSLIGMAADTVEVIGNIDDTEAFKLVVALAGAFAKNFSSKTFIKGLSETIFLIADPEATSQAVLGRFITTLVPFSSLTRQVTQALDPEVKQARSLLDEVRKTIPGLSETLPPEVDLFGNPRFLSGGLGRDIVHPAFRPIIDVSSPFFVTRITSPQRDIFDTLAKNEIRVPDIPETIEGVEILPAERNRIAQIAASIKINNKTMEEAFQELFTTRLWENAFPGKGEGREALVKNLVNKYYDQAKALFLRENDEVFQAVIDARRRKAIGRGAVLSNIEIQ